MTQRRSDQVNEDVTPYYHCVTRCVRRAFLCGEDRYSGKNFDHRRQWVVDRLILLGSIFAIDILAYAVMANHMHLVIALRSERAVGWSAAEVVARFGKLFPMAKAAYERMDEQQQAAKVEDWRERLSDLSWMMRGLNEYLARKANKEDGCTGRFWEGRFKSEALLDEGGLLACMAYVDLNPVRAGECDRLEDAKWTSIGERLKKTTAVGSGTSGLEAAGPEVAGFDPISVSQVEDERNAVDSPPAFEDEETSVPTGLAPFLDQVPELEPLSATDGSTEKCAFRVSDGASPIPMNFVDYIELLEWTGRHQRDRGPCGTLKGPPPAILSRLKIRPDGWLDAMSTHGLRSRGALGREESLCAFAQKRGRKRVAGRGFATTLFIR